MTSGRRYSPWRASEGNEPGPSEYRTRTPRIRRSNEESPSRPLHKVPISAVGSASINVGLSQSQFVDLCGVSVRTLMDWERGKRKPSGAAKNLIAIAASHPEVLHELLDDRLAV